MADKSNEDGFISNAYGVETIAETKEFYKDWAKTYDAEVSKYGYATPSRCGQALADLAPDLAAPVLDIGCGTGISGAALRAAGFANVDGSDLSAEMLDAARKKNIYRDLWQVDLDDPFPFTLGTYAHISAMGVIASGHAPPEMIDAVLAALPGGGLFVFSLNDHTLQDPAFEARVAENLDTGAATLLFKEHGEHLPGYDMKSNVYVMQKH